VSGSIADVLGWAATDLLGHVIDEFVHPDELAPSCQAAADAGAEGTASTEFRFRRPDGSYRWVLCHTRLKLDEDGTPVALVGGLVDIEARKAVEAQELDRLVELERFQRLTVGRELSGQVCKFVGDQAALGLAPLGVWVCWCRSSLSRRSARSAVVNFHLKGLAAAL